MQESKTRTALGKMMIRYGHQMLDGTCGLDDDEIMAMVELLATRKVNMEQTSTMLNIDPTTLRRKIQSKDLPQPRKEAGGKKYYFVKDLARLRKNG